MEIQKQEVILKIEDLTKSFGKTEVLKGISMEVHKNEIISVLGPSGCGKSTTLRMIAGLETPTSGRITIGDKVVFDSDLGINVPANKRKVGFLFQNYALWPNMTVYQNISFGLTNLKEEMDEIDFDARAAARMIEILQKPQDVVRAINECVDKKKKLNMDKAYLRLIDLYEISLFTAKALMDMKLHEAGDPKAAAAQEIKNAIAFIEEHTGEKWDWKAYFECAERVNYATKCRLEWLEMNKTDYPQVFGSNLALYTETNYMAICGKVPAFREVDRKITQLAERAYRKQKKAANEYRHRAIVWGVQSHFYMDFLVWLLNCWGIVPLTDMLSMVSTRELATTDTPENREQAYYDMAWLTENMIMRNRTHGGYKVLLDELWEFCEQFNADMVILWEHMSCKALDGMHGLFEERAREHGIHLVWVTHDLFDPRVISRQGVRQQVNDYMRTVMQEKPVDPSLEILKDDKSW